MPYNVTKIPHIVAGRRLNKAWAVLDLAWLSGGYYQGGGEEGEGSKYEI